MPALRRIFLGLLLGTVCASPALADDSRGESIRFFDSGFDGTARLIDSERMSITFDKLVHVGRGGALSMKHARLVYNLNTGRVVVSEDTDADSRTPANRYEATIPAKLGPKAVVSYIGWPGLVQKSLTKPAAPQTFLSKVKSLFKR